MKPMADLLKQYLGENRLGEPYTFDYPLFSNRSGNRVTAHILKKYLPKLEENPAEMSS